MKALYETKTIITVEEYRKLNRALSNRRVFTLVLLLAEIAMAALLAVNIARHGSRSSTQTYVIMLVLIPIIAYFVPRYLERRMYGANKTVNNVVTTTKFYKNYLELHNQHGDSTLKYADLYRIIETGTNFYLMASKEKVVIIVKQNCHPKLIAFIQELRQKLADGTLKNE